MSDSFVDTKLLRKSAMDTAINGRCNIELSLLLQLLDQHDALVKALSRASAPHASNCSVPYFYQGDRCPCGAGELLLLARFLK